MKTLRLVSPILAIGLLVFGFVWWSPKMVPSTPAESPVLATRPANIIRLGLVPEHDIFALRKSYQKLAGYLSRKLQQPVEMVTLHTYEAVLFDFKERQIEGAFLGSLVAVLAIEQQNAQALAAPQRADGSSSYRSVLFVPETSSITSISQLKGKTVAAVRTTTAGCLFAMQQLTKAGLADGPGAPALLAVGTHDDVPKAVLGGQADAGSVKDLRLEAYLAANPTAKVRRLAMSRPVPNNALVVRADLADGLGQRIAEALLEMERDPQGREALAELGAVRFVPVTAEEYRPVYDMIRDIGTAWERVGIQCVPPKGPATRPAR